MTQRTQPPPATGVKRELLCQVALPGCSVAAKTYVRRDDGALIDACDHCYAKCRADEGAAA